MNNEQVAHELVKIARELTGAKFPYQLIEQGQRDVRELRDMAKSVAKVKGVEKEAAALASAMTAAYAKLTALRTKARREGI